MNKETPPEQPPQDGPDGSILMLVVDETYYLAVGEEHMDQIMLVDGTFPKPIRCMKFRDQLHLKTFSNGKASLANLWAINPIVIERLRRDQHLLEIDAP